MSPHIREILSEVVEREGGLVDHPDDPGGLTNYGISQRAHPTVDIRNLTKEGAVEIYYRDYVLRPRFHLLPQALQEPLIDFGVNAGPERAVQCLQRVLGVAVDGKIGPQTLSKLDRRPLETVLFEFNVERLLHYLTITVANPSLKTFARGWFRRAMQVFTRSMKTLLLVLSLLLPAQALAQIPNHRDAVADIAELFPEAWACAHTGRACSDDYIKLLASYLHYEVDARFHLNGKRGNPNDISDDAICFDGVSVKGDVDPTRNNAPVTVLDVIGGAGGPNPTPQWGAVGPATPRPHAACVKPERIHDTWGSKTPPPTPTPTPSPSPAPTVDLSEVIAKLDALRAEQSALVDRIDALAAHLGRVEQQVHKNGGEVLESKQLLLNPPAYRGSIFGKGFSLNPEPR